MLCWPKLVCTTTAVTILNCAQLVESTTECVRLPSLTQVILTSLEAWQNKPVRSRYCWTLLYACETWVTYKRHLQLLERFHQRCLRKILHITWEDRQTNISVLEESKISGVEAMILQHQLRWTGHVVRMPDDHLPKQLLYSRHKNGNAGGQQKR